MKTIRQPTSTPSEPGPPGSTAHVLGWLAGLALLVVPVFVAGVLATAGGMLEVLVRSGVTEPQVWDAERTFPWLYIAAFGVCLGGIAFGCVRSPGFRRGALPATALAVGLLGGIVLIGFLLA